MRSDDAPDVVPRKPMSLALVQREVALLLVLSIVSIGLFLITRRLAEWERVRTREEAAIWFEQGQALLQAGESADATAALRRAVTAERQNTTYVMGLARALADSNHDAEARRLLMRLREVMPDSAEVNFRLARLLAKENALDSAVRYYYLALYSPDTAGVADERFAIGFELATLLLETGDMSGAAGTLTTIAADIPDAAGPHVQVATLLERARAYSAALDHFVVAGEFDPTSIAAASGAGRVALGLHAYEDAERYFSRAVDLGSTGDAVALETAATARRVDPLVRGLTSRARAARLVGGLSWALSALEACAPAEAAMPEQEPVTSLRPVLATFSKTYTPVDLRDADLLAEGIGLVVRAANALALTCGTNDADVRAWRIVGQRTDGSAS